MFERNHFMPKRALRWRTEVSRLPQRYNITSQGLLEPVNRSSSACTRFRRMCVIPATLQEPQKITVLRAADELLKQNQTNCAQHSLPFPHEEFDGPSSCRCRPVSFVVTTYAVIHRQNLAHVRFTISLKRSTRKSSAIHRLGRPIATSLERITDSSRTSRHVRKVLPTSEVTTLPTMPGETDRQALKLCCCAPIIGEPSTAHARAHRAPKQDPGRDCMLDSR